MKNIFKVLLMSLTVVVFASCNEDYWNEDNFTPSDYEFVPTDVQQIEYVLTEADYGAVADNSTNKALAGTATTALANVKKYQNFTSTIEAKDFLPAFMGSSSFKYFTLDAGSSVKVTYNYYDSSLIPSDDIDDVESAKTYTVSTDDYKAAWGDENSYAKYFTPAIPASATIPSALKSAITGAASGDYAIVTYNYAETEPVLGESDVFEYTSVISTLVSGNTCEVKGVVTGICKQGFIVTDNSGSVLVYFGGSYDPTLYAVGDQVAISGTVGDYKGGLQITSAVVTANEKVEYTYPTPERWGASDLTAFSALIAGNAKVTAQYVTYTALYTKSGSNYNFTMDGIASKGSYYQGYNVDESLLNKTVDVTGWVISATGTGSIYINTIVTDIRENTLSSVLGGLTKDDACNATAMVTGVTSNGLVLTDNSGSIFYFNSSYDKTITMGDVVTASGTVGAYNYGTQLTSAATITKTGKKMIVAYPTNALELTGAAMDDLLTSRTTDQAPIYATMTGEVTISGNYYNVNVSGATTAIGSIYNATDAIKAQLENGKKYTLSGYFITISKTGGNPKYINLIVTGVESASSTLAPMRTAMKAAAQDTSVPKTKYAIYKFNGTAWSVASNAIALQSEDYTAMGQSYGNLSSSAPAENYLPAFLDKSYPYAQEGDDMIVVYKYYDGSQTSNTASYYVFKNGAWVAESGVIAVTDQFVKNSSGWVYDPSVVIELLPIKGNTLSTSYYQTIADYVAATFGSKYYQSGYVNAEYYYGTSAYYNNVTFVINKWRTDTQGGADYYESYNDEELREFQYVRLQDAFIPALEKYYPDIAPVEGADVTVTVKFGLYTGTTITECNYYVIYNVTGKGQFEYASMGEL